MWALSPAARKSRSMPVPMQRNALRVAVAWNDPSEPGYLVQKASIDVRVGISHLRSTDNVNTIDRLIHPVDRGNRAEALAAFERYQTLLRAELGLEASPLIQSVIDDIQSL